MPERGQITIVGLGAIGGSIGLALGERAGDVLVVGHDRDHGMANLAKGMGAVARTDWNLIAACEDADLVILAIPAGEIPATLQALAPHLKEGCVLTDTADVKAPIMRQASELLGETVDFIGGNPIVDPGEEGLAGARADLFESAWYCLTPSERAPERAVKLVGDLVELLGARRYFLEAAEHDGLMTGARQLPILAAASLANTLAEEVQEREMGWLRKAALRSVPSLHVEPDAYAGAVLENRENLARWLDAYMERLGELRMALAGEDARFVEDRLRAALEARESWEGAGESERSPMDEVRSSPWRLFLGGFASDRMDRGRAGKGR